MKWIRYLWYFLHRGYYTVRNKSLFREDGTTFICLICGGYAGVVVEKSGIIPGTPSEAQGRWFEGKIVCQDCRASEVWCDST